MVNSGVAQDSVFYVLNPDNNLPDTEKILEGALRSWASWEGVVGKAPEKQEMKTAPGGQGRLHLLRSRVQEQVPEY